MNLTAVALLPTQPETRVCFVSARLAYHRNLVVFPDALGGGSFVE